MGSAYILGLCPAYFKTPVPHLFKAGLFLLSLPLPCWGSPLFPAPLSCGFGLGRQGSGRLGVWLLMELFSPCHGPLIQPQLVASQLLQSSPWPQVAVTHKHVVPKPVFLVATSYQAWSPAVSRHRVLGPGHYRDRPVPTLLGGPPPPTQRAFSWAPSAQGRPPWARLLVSPVAAGLCPLDLGRKSQALHSQGEERTVIVP
jgi:hypothetical protein